MTREELVGMLAARFCEDFAETMARRVLEADAVATLPCRGDRVLRQPASSVACEGRLPERLRPRTALFPRARALHAPCGRVL